MTKYFTNLSSIYLVWHLLENEYIYGPGSLRGKQVSEQIKVALQFIK